MQIAPFTFKEFSGDTATLVDRPAKPFLPGGRFRGEVPPPPPAPTFNEEQVKAAEREAYKKGFLEGKQEGVKETENAQADVAAKLATTAEGFVQALGPVFADYRKMTLQLKEDVPNVALAVARKIAGAALKDNVQATVEDIVTRCVDTMAGAPSLIITVHESLGEALEQKLALLATDAQESMDITVMRDPAIGIADCRIEWKNGEFVRDTARLWQDIERAIEALTVSATHDATVSMDALQKQLPDNVQVPENNPPAPETGQEPPQESKE